MANAPLAAGGGRIDLLSGPVVGTLLLFALPALASNVMQSVSGMVNAVWVGRLLGHDALAAVSNASLVLTAVLAILQGLGIAAAMLIGQCAGRGHVDALRRVMGTSLALTALAGGGIGALGWWLTPQILTWLATPADAYPLALGYLRLQFLGLPAAFLCSLMLLSLRGIGNWRIPLAFITLNAVIDLGLNPLLILGWGPIPPLGIAGSAIAALLASAISALGMMACIRARDLALRLRGEEWRYLQPDVHLLRVIVGKGSMMGLQMLLMASSGLLLARMVNSYGSATAAAYGAVTQLWQYTQIPAFALASAVIAMAAQNLGARRWDRLQVLARGGILTTVLLSGTLVLTLLACDRPMLALFLREPQGLETAVHLNRIGVWATIATAMAAIPGAIMRANGAVLAPLLMLFVSMFPVRLGIAWGLQPQLGADAIWWSLPISAACSLAFTGAYYRWGPWRRQLLLHSIRVQDEAASRPPTARTGALLELSA